MTTTRKAVLAFSGGRDTSAMHNQADAGGFIELDARFLPPGRAWALRPDR